jgi:hypothetical protein
VFHKYSTATDEDTEKTINKLAAISVGKIKPPPHQSDPKGSNQSEKGIEEVQESSGLSGDTTEAFEEEIEEARQREHLERTAATLRHKLEMSEQSRYNENLRIMHENVVLLT